MKGIEVRLKNLDTDTLTDVVETTNNMAMMATSEIWLLMFCKSEE